MILALKENITFYKQYSYHWVWMVDLMHQISDNEELSC